MTGIQVAESSRKRTEKTLGHVEIRPQLGGGHVIKHVYTSYEHEPLEVKFNEDGKREGKGGREHVIAHLMKHAGLPPMMEAAEGEGDETEHENKHAAMPARMEK